MSRENLLIIMVDQMSGALLGDGMIEHLHIPNMRRLIERGVKFDNAYSSSPLCTPARGSFMTGQLPSRNGIYDNAAEFQASTPSFAHYLRDMGYQTALSGKMHFVGPDQLHGFEERLTTDIYPADFGWTPNWERPLERIDWWYHNLSSVTEAGVAQISNQLEFDDEVAYQAKLKLHQYARRLDPRPFCLCVSFTHPHDPYVSRPQYWDLYDHAEIPMPRVPAIAYASQDPHSQRLMDAADHTRYDVRDEHVRRARHAYLANISYLDARLGEILDVLQKCDFTDSTSIVLCSDHGDMLGERGLWYKMSFFEYASRVPLVICAPNRFSPGRVGTPVATHDLLPTLIELAGGDPAPEHLACEIDGASLVGLATSKSTASPRPVYAEYCAEGSVAPLVMIRRQQYKFVHCPADPPQMFDLQADPLELHNLAGEKAFAETLAGFVLEMEKRWDLTRFAEEVKRSQASRHLVDRANRQGKFAAWDYQPHQAATERFMRNHLDLNALEANNRYPKSALRLPSDPE